MNKTAYLVLSVKDIRRLLNTATGNQKAHKKKTTHCIVLRNLQLVDVLGRHQLSSVSLEVARQAVEADTLKTLRIKSDVI